MEEVNKGLHINIDSLSNPDNEKGAGLPVDGLTDSLQRIIRELSDYYQSPQDFVAASMFHCAGTLLGNKVKLRTAGGQRLIGEQWLYGSSLRMQRNKRSLVNHN